MSTIADNFRAERVRDDLPVYMARSRSGLPIFLVEQQGVVSDTPVELRHVRARFNARCDIATASETRKAVFSIVELHDADGAVLAHFLWLVGRLIASLNSAAGLRAGILALVELLRALETRSSKTLQGLFGELLLIRTASDPRILVKAWRQIDRERFDFALGGDRLEVKTCIQGPRRHYFSLDQVEATELRVVIASLTIEQVGGGKTITELADEIRESLRETAELLKFERVLIGTLGRDWRLAVNERFDERLGRESLRFFDAKSIPRPSCPPEVNDVHFAVIAEGLPALRRDDLLGSELFAAM